MTLEQSLTAAAAEQRRIGFEEFTPTQTGIMILEERRELAEAYEALARCERLLREQGL